MEPLANSSCAPCRLIRQPATDVEIDALRQQVADWQIVPRDGVARLERVFLFRDFVEALSFANNVGRIAEAEGHHPALLVEWGRVSVAWWTHSLNALHQNDFIMAAKTDRLYMPPAERQYAVGEAR